MTALSPLVEASWLGEHAADADVVILDARIAKSTESGSTTYRSGRTGFTQDGHIPGSRYADLVTEFSDATARFPFTRPSPAQFEAAARQLGVRNDSTVVVYDSLNSAWAARVWLLFRSFGHSRVAVLNGGLQAWLSHGGDLERGDPPAATPGDFVAAATDDLFVDVPAVQAALARSDTTVLCGLDHAVYTGDRAGNALRPGHIPGSESLPFADLLDEDGRVDPTLAAAAADRFELAAASQVITYCGGGINASGLALALAAAGLPGIQVFDGSLSEWAADPSLPLVLGAAAHP